MDAQDGQHGQQDGGKQAAADYHERLSPPWWLWVVTAILCLTLAVAVLPALGPVPALVVLAVTEGGAGWLLASSAARVEVRAGMLRAGRARIPVALLGAPVPLDADRARLLRGPDIDPAAYHLIRGWVGTAVLVDVLDPEDPTPYWYVATRHPQRLAAALDRARQGG